MNQIFQHTASTLNSTLNSCLTKTTSKNSCFEKQNNLAIKKTLKPEYQMYMKTPSQILSNVTTTLNQQQNDKLSKASLKSKQHYRRYKSVNLRLNEQKKDALQTSTSTNELNSNFNTKKPFLYFSSTKDNNFLTKSKRQLNSGYNLLFQRLFGSTATLLVTSKEKTNNQKQNQRHSSYSVLENLMPVLPAKNTLKQNKFFASNIRQNTTNLTKNCSTSTANVRFRPNFKPSATSCTSKFSILSEKKRRKICDSVIEFSTPRSSLVGDTKKINRKRRIIKSLVSQPKLSIHLKSHLAPDGKTTERAVNFFKILF